MKTLKTSLAALFAAVSLTAVTPATQAQETNPTPPPPRAGGPRGAMSVEDRLARLTETLKLTDEQKPKVKAVLEVQSKAMQEARGLSPEDRRAKMQTVREEMTKKMKEILTPDQFTKFEAMPQGPRGRRGGQGGGTNAPAGGA